ncbi:hypothetical protein FHX74_000523 [Friedmanniella endophytica]|uniref:MrfA-like Zn-binding domain-containing protein n=1 Tax=Microlunatus kandeliicorticis TaxID=1759536 RepID=A0A7W3P4I4_9ACTN|nr:DUF1998 domain-containing protein [Microlunatus kandeliicorticis]MBA8792929.1 hypothetical protein [Microlunatus kandeliicorticis]
MTVQPPPVGIAGDQVLLPANEPLDPLGDAERVSTEGSKRNFARVGSGRPSSLIFTYGPGAIMDLPQFTIMPAGLDDWDRIWRRRDGIPRIHAPRLLEVVRLMLGPQVEQLRPFPWQPAPNTRSREGADLGVPARVFPQWLRCTGCDLLGPLPKFDYRNTHPYRADEARFEHANCRGRAAARGVGRGAATLSGARRTAVAARYLLVCADGHVDEFPYQLWVHRGQPCEKAEAPVLRMTDSTAGRGSAVITCDSCTLRRGMNEALGELGRLKLPRCRGRHPHLDSFNPAGCDNETRLMLVGASNLWFAATQSVIVMPQTKAEAVDDLADRIRIELADELDDYRANPRLVRGRLKQTIDISEVSDAELEELLARASAPVMAEDERRARQEKWSPVDLLVPEWRYLQREPLGAQHDDPSGLMLSTRPLGRSMPTGVARVLAVDKLRKVNALFGFTRIDELDRVNDLGSRLVPLARARPTWTVATEDRGEGVFLQFDEPSVAQWEAEIADSEIWHAHREAHWRNYRNRMSETAKSVDPDERLPPPRYWLLHTFAHLLIRGMAMECGYSAASLSERIYSWPGVGDREPAAGVLICTTASDSDGTLGGLVALSQPDRLARVVETALHRARRCSSDPVCASRTPRDPEDFLHGAACHCCAMASETSCERANRFLDRRFVIDLPGSSLGFFK